MGGKFLWANNLRAFATISVILLHVSASILGKYGSISDSTWWIGNVYDSSVRFCVPIFLMLTGALILPKTYELSYFFKKRFSRIFFPFLFWSSIYIAYNLILKWDNGDEMGLVTISKYTFVQFKRGASHHLWYIYMLIGIYLIIPIISKWIINSTKKEIKYYLIVWFIVILIGIPIIHKLKPNVDLRYFSGYLGYPVLGYFLAYKVKIKNNLIPLLLALIGILITIIGTYIVTKDSGHFSSRFYQYLSPNVLMTSIGVFLLFKNLNVKAERVNKIFDLISTYSYGIYLSHIIVLYFLTEVGLTSMFINPIIGIPLTTIVCLILSILVTYIINKIPYGKYVSG